MNDINAILGSPSSDIAPKAGNVLISEPFMQDLYFSRAVVYLIDHNEKETLGLVINKRSGLVLGELDKDLKSSLIPVYIGGPVEADSLFYVHQVGDIIPKSVQVTGNIYFGGEWETVRSLIADGILNELNIKLCLGYSGWTPGQLDEEIKSKSWVVSDIHPDKLFEHPDTDLWKYAVQNLGKKYENWINFPAHPVLN